MNKQRRLFLSQMSMLAGVAAINKPFASIASVSKHVYSLHTAEHAVTIYHTNDLRGKMDAVYNNLGGINQVKDILAKEETNGLLLDAGNFLNNATSLRDHQYIIRTMNNMGYTVASPGYNELLNGQAHLATLIPTMKFKLVNCNYGFDSELSRSINPYVIVNTGKFKVGVTGVGPQLSGVRYNDAIQSANKVAALLKEKENCDLVICLSQLEYKAKGNTPDNLKLAQQSEHIDMIIGGHSRKLTACPATTANKLKRAVILSQAASEGLMLGRTIFNFENGKQSCTIKSKYFIPGQPNAEDFCASLAALRLKEKAA